MPNYDLTFTEPVKMIDPPAKTYELIRNRIKQSGKRFFACDNVSEFVSEQDRSQLIDELAEVFEKALDILLIDRENDPNSKDTGRRMAKMYINELMTGRFDKEPDVTAFPNDDAENRYTGLLITRAEIKSMCSHHHQPVTGVCYIGLIPGTKVIGLSKYARIAQWYGRRGQLQEELTKQIADAIQHHTKTQDIGVVVSAQHGCCTNRGIMATDSTTITSVLRGQFFNPSVKNEFFMMIGQTKNRLICE